MQLLKSFTHMREQTEPFDLERMEHVGELLDTFIKSPNKNTPPEKRLLQNAAAALLHPEARKLSAKWTKPQLADAIRQWISQALLLEKPSMQSNLYLEIRKCKQKPKHCEHTVYIEEDDGSIAAFSVGSPSSSKGAAKKRKKKASAKAKISSPAGSDLPSVPAHDLDDTPGSLHSAGTFMREIEELAKDVSFCDLATTEDVTPGVGKAVTEEKGASSATTEVEDIDACLPLAAPKSHATPASGKRKAGISSCPAPARKIRDVRSPSKKKPRKKINNKRGWLHFR